MLYNIFLENVVRESQVLKKFIRNFEDSTEHLDRSYAEHPTNYIGFNKVASAIDELALKLEKSIK